MIRKIIEFFKKRKRKKEIENVVKKTLHSISDKEEHLRLNIELRNPEKNKE